MLSSDISGSRNLTDDLTAFAGGAPAHIVPVPAYSLLTSPFIQRQDGSFLGVLDESNYGTAAIYLRQLCHALLSSQLSSQGIELTVDASPLQLHSVQCWRMGLIVAELVTNSGRHAFSGNGGVIHVELVSWDAAVECCVEDNGRALEDVRPGRGLRIVAALTETLGGSMDHRFGPQGTRSTLTFPLVEQLPPR